MSQNGPATQTGARLLMLGLDAVSLPFIKENPGRLPVIASLLKSGVVSELQSPASNLAASVWPTEQMSSRTPSTVSSAVRRMAAGFTRRPLNI